LELTEELAEAVDPGHVDRNDRFLQERPSGRVDLL
jgi:hypothetical protein